MRNLLTIAILLCSCCIFAAEDQPKLPSNVQTLLDGYNKAVTKIQDEAEHKTNVEREKLYAALDKAKADAAKRGDADAIVAIKSQMDKLVAEANEKADKTDMLGVKIEPAKAILGKWNLGDTGLMWVFTDDNKCASMPSGTPGIWKMKNDTEVEVQWSTREQDTITLATMKANTPGGTHKLSPAK